jgi:hypothetical protein
MHELAVTVVLEEKKQWYGTDFQLRTMRFFS